MTRRSKCELERALDDFDDGEYPEAGLITVLSAVHNDGTAECVDSERGLWRINGAVMRLLPNAREKFARLPGDESHSDR